MRRCTTFIFAILFALLPGAAYAEDKFFDSNGVQIHYVEEGSGPPVVLVHGYTADIEWNWARPGVIADLAKDHHVVALDARGHGKSARPHDAGAYGIQMTEDVVRLMDHLKIQRAHIVGYSMGGIITMKLLTTHPERFLTATIAGMGPHEVSPDDAKAAAEIERGDFRLLLAKTWASNQPPPTEDVIRQQSEVLIARDTRNNDVMALAQAWRGLPSLDVTDAQLAAVRIPMQAVVGSNDPLIKRVNYLKGIRPSLPVTLIEGANHLTAPGRPEFVAAIRDFIDKTPAAK